MNAALEMEPPKRFRATVVRTTTAVLLSALLFFPHFLAELGSLRVIAIAIGLTAVSVELFLLPIRRLSQFLLIAISCIYVAIAGVASEFVAGQLNDRFFAVNAEHLFILLPVFAALGGLIVRSDGARIYLRTFLAIASVVAALAIGESLFDSSLLGRDYEFLTSQREGINRALVGSEHVLVLGATLAAAAPLAAKLRPAVLRIGISVLLVAGCWATGSRAPAAISTAVVLVLLLPALGRFVQSHLWVLYLGAGLAVGIFGYLSLFVWDPYIEGDTGLAYSANYRWASYSLIPRILAEHPLGYLLSGTPPGEWTVGSELRGTVDIGRSADAEILFSAFGLGWIGITFFLLALFFSITAIKHDLEVGFASLTLTGIGFFLALHGWDGMSPFWYMLIGMCVCLSLWPQIGRLRERAAQTWVAPSQASGENR